LFFLPLRYGSCAPPSSIGCDEVAGDFSDSFTPSVRPSCLQHTPTLPTPPARRNLRPAEHCVRIRDAGARVAPPRLHGSTRSAHLAGVTGRRPSPVVARGGRARGRGAGPVRPVSTGRRRAAARPPARARPRCAGVRTQPAAASAQPPVRSNTGSGARRRRRSAASEHRRLPDPMRRPETNQRPTADPTPPLRAVSR